MSNSHLIFLSYASPDQSRVLEWYRTLSDQGYNVWMDIQRLKGGQNWEYEIKRALQKATIVIAFLSNNSVDRRGYVKKEIRLSLDHASKKLTDDIYIIPVMLDEDLEIPPEFEGIHIIKQGDGNCIAKTMESIDEQLKRMGEHTERIQGEHSLKWTYVEHKETWDGLPGYEASYQLIQTNSQIVKNISDITSIINGWIINNVMKLRSVKFEQDLQMHNFGQKRYNRTNVWDASPSEPKIKYNIISIQYTMWWNYALSVHPNHAFQTFNFIIDPLIQIEKIEHIFENKDDAFLIIQEYVRNDLINKEVNECNVTGSFLNLDKEYVLSGTKEWGDFQQFTFGDDSLEFHFSPYAVAPYVMGSQFSAIPYEKIAHLFRAPVTYALGIRHLIDNGRNARPSRYPVELNDCAPTSSTEDTSRDVPPAS